MRGFGSWLDSIRRIMRQDTGLNGDAQRIEQLAWMIFLKIFSDKEKQQTIANPRYRSIIPERYRWENWALDPSQIPAEEIHFFIENELFVRLRELKKEYPHGDQHIKACIVSEVFEGNNYMKDGASIHKVLEKLNQIDFNVEKERHHFGEIYESMLQELQSAGKSGEFYTPRAITQFIAKIIKPLPGEKILDPSCGTGGYLVSALGELKRHCPEPSQLQQLAKNVEGWEYKPLPSLLAITNLILHDIEIPSIIYKDSLKKPLSAYTDEEKVNIILANPPFGSLVSGNNEMNFPEDFRSKDSAILFLVLIIELLKDGGRAGIVLPDSALNGEGAKERVRKMLLKKCNLHTIIRLHQSVFQPYAKVATNLLFFTKGRPTDTIWYYELMPPAGKSGYSKTHPIQFSEFEPVIEWWENRQSGPTAWKVKLEDIEQNGWKLDFKNPIEDNEQENLSYSEIKEQLFTDFQSIQRLFDSIRPKL